MSAKNITAQIQIRRDTATNWENSNPVLSEGEFGYDTTNKQIKIGDGVSNWNSLSFIGNGGGSVDKYVVINDALLINNKQTTLSKPSNAYVHNGTSYTYKGVCSTNNIDVTDTFDWDLVENRFFPTYFVLGLKGTFSSSTPDISTLSEFIMKFDFSAVKKSSTGFEFQTEFMQISNIFGWKNGANNFTRTGDMIISFKLVVDTSTKLATFSMEEYFNATNYSFTSKYNWLNAVLYYMKTETSA